MEETEKPAPKKRGAKPGEKRRLGWRKSEPTATAQKTVRLPILQITEMDTEQGGFHAAIRRAVDMYLSSVRG